MTDHDHEHLIRSVSPSADTAALSTRSFRALLPSDPAVAAVMRLTAADLLAGQRRHVIPDEVTGRRLRMM